MSTPEHLSAEFAQLRRTILAGDVPLRIGLERLDALSRMARTAGQGEISRRVLYFLARVAGIHGADHAVARRALAHARVSLGRSFPFADGIELRIHEAEALGHAGDVAGACAALSEVLRMRSVDDGEPLRFHALWSLIDLLLSVGSIDQSLEALAWGRQKAATELSWRRFAYVLQLIEADVYVKRAYLAHPFYSEALITYRPSRRDDFMPLSEGARASALQLLQLDHLRPNVPSDFLSQEAVMFARDQVLLAAELLRPEESQIERASAAAEAWMKAGHLIPLVYVTEHLAMALILRSRATTAVGLIERVLERWLTTGRHDEVSNSLLYCLYKAHQASGNDAAALTQFQRYVESARKSLRPSVSSLHLPMSTANGRMGPGGAPRHLRLAVEIVAQEFSDPALTVESLAARVGVSDRTLRAAFSLHMGKSPLQYLRDFRLDRARDLMLLMLRSRQAHTSIRQIALDCGINHAGRFAHAFAQRFGQSPSDLMRSVELERPSKG